MATPNYDIDLEKNPELQSVRTEENKAIDQNAATYDNMVKQTDSFYNAQIAGVNQWENTQKKLQNEQTDFTIDKIEQQKEHTRKDYIKEQSGAYTDWQKQSNQYGANAEQKAAGGMQNTGYSESSQVAMYNQYQARIVAAREVYSRAVLDYDNAIKEAQLQNSAALAQIAYESLQKRLELSLQGFQYKNQLISEKADREMQIKTLYQNKWATVLTEIMEENKLEESARQHSETLAESIRHNKATEALEQSKFAYQKLKDSGGLITSGGKGNGAKGKITGKKNTGKKNTGDNYKVNITDKTDDGFNGSSYKEAVAYMTKHGVDNAKASSMMTETEWQRRKNAGSGSAHVKNYSSYAAYVRDYVSYATK